MEDKAYAYFAKQKIRRSVKMKTTENAVIIDKSYAFRNYLKQNLKKHGISVVGEYLNAKDSLSILRKIKPNLIFVGTVANSQVGINDIQAVVRKNPISQVIVLSNNNPAELYSEIIENHVVAFFKKPISIPKILDVVKDMRNRNLRISEKKQMVLSLCFSRPFKQMDQVQQVQEEENKTATVNLEEPSTEEKLKGEENGSMESTESIEPVKDEKTEAFSDDGFIEIPHSSEGETVEPFSGFNELFKKRSSFNLERQLQDEEIGKEPETTIGEKVVFEEAKNEFKMHAILFSEKKKKNKAKKDIELEKKQAANIEIKPPEIYKIEDKTEQDGIDTSKSNQNRKKLYNKKNKRTTLFGRIKG